MTTLSTTDLDMDLIKRTIAVGASNDELALFAAQCRRTGLDPFARQINFVLRRSKSPNGDWTQKATIMVSIDGARLMAARTGLYNGSETWWCGEDGQWVDVWLTNFAPAAAKVSVMRGSGQFTGIALWREYGASASGPVWKNMPAHMLAKCAEMLALRKAFPAELSGLYSADEMAQADTQVVESAPAPAQIVVKDKPTRICDKLTYYKHPAHLLATLRKDQGDPAWDWPADDDTDSWEYVWNTAKAYAQLKSEPVPVPLVDLPELISDELPFQPTTLQTSVDKQVQLMLENAKKSSDLKNKSGGAGRRQLSR
jgi:phage recombination protein Bet